MSTVLENEMSVAEFLALPEDGMDRELMRGELREKPMTVRNRFHSELTSTISWILKSWAMQQPEPPRVFGGEAGFILPTDEATIVGIDTAVVSAQVMARQSDDTSLIEGAPLLAVEILSPSDTVEALHEKNQVYLDSGVAEVWNVDPIERTVKVLRSDAPPILFNDRQTLAAGPELPGLEIPVSSLFAS